MKNNKQPNQKDTEKTVKEFYESLGGHSHNAGPYLNLENEKTRILRKKIILTLSVLLVACAFYGAGLLTASSNQSTVKANDDSGFQSGFQKGIEQQKKYTYDRCVTYAKAYPYLEYELGPSKVWCNFFTGEIKSREELGME